MANSRPKVATFEGVPGGMNVAVPAHEIDDLQAYYLQDILLDQAGMTRRRGPVRAVTGVATFSLPIFGIGVTTDPASVIQIAVLEGDASNAYLSVLSSDYATATRLAWHGTFPTSPYYIAEFKPLIGGGTVIGTSKQYDSASPVQALGIWQGASKPAYSIGTVSSTRGSTAVTGSSTTWTSNASAGMFLFSDNKFVGVVKSIGSNTAITLVHPALISVSGATYELRPVRGINPRVVKGYITCATSSAVVTGSNTKFKDQDLGAGTWDIFRARDLAFIGTVSALTNNTSLTMSSNAAIACDNERYVAIKRNGDYGLQTSGSSSVGSGIDADAKLVLHCDGTDASTTFTDSSLSPKTVTAVGNAQIDTAQSKFGVSSALFDGTGDKLTIADSADWNFAAGDFTVDFYVRFASTAGIKGLVAQYTSTGDQRSWYIFHSGTDLTFLGSTAGTSGNVSKAFAWTPSINTWYHVAVTRSGNNLRAFVDGTQIGITQTVTETFFDANSVLSIADNGGGSDSPSGIDANAKLVLHCNGTDASTTFTDSSLSPKTITANGNAQVDTAQLKFGSASGLFDGTGDYLSSADSADWFFGSGNFTLDLWVRFASVGSVQTLIAQWDSAGADGVSWEVEFNNTIPDLKFRYSTSGTAASATWSFAWSPSINIWYHVAAVRSGADFKVFIDGTQIGSTQNIAAAVLADVIAPLTVGSRPGTGGQSLNGWVDEVRVSKGIARWTANFTPPTAEYAPLVNEALNGWMDEIRVSKGIARWTANFTPQAEAYAVPVITTVERKVGFISAIYARRQWYANLALPGYTSHLWFSDESDPEAIDLSPIDGDFIPVSSGTPRSLNAPIRAIVSAYNSLLILKDTETFALFGETPETFEVRKITDDGTFSGMSAQPYEGGVIYAGRNNIYYYDGVEAQSLTQYTLGDWYRTAVLAFNPNTHRMWSTVDRDHYWVFIESAAPPITPIKSKTASSVTRMAICIHIPSKASTIWTNFNIRGSVTLPAETGRGPWYIVNTAAGGRLCDTAALFTEDAVDVLTCSGDAAGPDFYIESKKYAMSEPAIQKLWKSMAAHYQSAVDGLKIDVIPGLLNRDATSTLTLPASTHTWDTLSSAYSTWDALAFSYSTWNSIIDPVFLFKRRKFLKREYFLSFRIYQSSTTNTKVRIGPWALGFKFLRVGRF